MMMSSGGMPYFSVSSSYGALGHRQLALARERLRLQLVLVDASRPPAPRRSACAMRADALELLLAVLQVDRVDDALALAVGQRQLHRLRVGGVDHDRRFDLADQLLVERRDVLDLVAVGALQADVDDVRAVLHLPARDLGGLFPLLLGDQVLEQPRADHVGALADDQRPVALVGLHQFDAGIVGAMRGAPAARRGCLPVDHLRDRADVRGRGAAAAADDVEPAVVDEALELRRERLRRLAVLALLVRQARRSDSRRRACGDISLSVRMWSVMNSGPVAQFSPIESRSACAIEA